MSRRTERVGRLIQQTLGQIILRDVSDPRVDPARVSVTRVAVVEDLTRAKVYVSVMGSESEQTKALRALRHAAGMLQERMMEQIQLRFTPVLDFVADVQFKKTLTTLALIQEEMAKLRQREQARAEAGSSEADSPGETSEDSPAGSGAAQDAGGPVGDQKPAVGRVDPGRENE